MISSWVPLPPLAPIQAWVDLQAPLRPQNWPVQTYNSNNGSVVNRQGVRSGSHCNGVTLRSPPNESPMVGSGYAHVGGLYTWPKVAKYVQTVTICPWASRNGPSVGIFFQN